MKVYHFLKTEHAISNLSLRHLKISRFNELNDPFEMLAADTLDREHLTALGKLKQEIDKTTGLICFSRAWSNPLLWGHYADKHSGVALGFEVPDDLIVKIRYTKNRPKIEVDKKTMKIIDGPSVVDRLISAKFSDWEYEDEYRLFFGLDHSTKVGEHYFTDFSQQLLLREVVLGLNCELAISTVSQMLGDDERKKLRVIKAGLHRREFKVIEDRSARVSV